MIISLWDLQQSIKLLCLKSLYLQIVNKSYYAEFIRRMKDWKNDVL